jgi:hypothetical protein
MGLVILAVTFFILAVFALIMAITSSIDGEGYGFLTFITLAIMFSFAGMAFLFGHSDEIDKANFLKMLRTDSGLNVSSASKENATIDCTNSSLHVPIQFVENKYHLVYFTTSTSFVILDKTNINKFFPYHCEL